jgi:hypothetical protein
MDTEVVSGLIGAAFGVVLASLVGLVVWHFKRPAEIRDALIQKKMDDRWDSAEELRHSLRELRHCRDHIFEGHLQYVERGGAFRRKARQQVRSSSLLGQAVERDVYALTDRYEILFDRVEGGQELEGLAMEIHELDIAANASLDDARRLETRMSSHEQRAPHRRGSPPGVSQGQAYS